MLFLLSIIIPVYTIESFCAPRFFDNTKIKVIELRIGLKLFQFLSCG